MFADLLGAAPLVSRCVVESGGVASVASHIGNFEHLANEVLPGVKWSTAHCVQSVEHELQKLKLDSLITSWGETPIQIISNLRAHFKQVRAASQSSKFEAGDDS
jgi:hypothetical protein